MMSLERMDAASSKMRRAQALVRLVLASAHQVSFEDLLETLESVVEVQDEAQEALEEAYRLQKKPGLAPAFEGAALAPVVANLPLTANRRPS